MYAGKSWSWETNTNTVTCPLPHPCGRSFWSRKQRKAEKGEAFIQQNHMSKLLTENFHYTDLNSMQLLRSCIVHDNQKEMYQTKNTTKPRTHSISKYPSNAFRCLTLCTMELFRGHREGAYSEEHLLSRYPTL